MNFLPGEGTTEEDFYYRMSLVTYLKQEHIPHTRNMDMAVMADVSGHVLNGKKTFFHDLQSIAGVITWLCHIPSRP
jgi:hypothetical protein